MVGMLKCADNSPPIKIMIMIVMRHLNRTATFNALLGRV